MAIKTERSFNSADRYYYDFGPCSYEKGFAQIDSRQDASYFGNWCNPDSLVLVSYAEGDVAITTCDTDAEFITAMRQTEAAYLRVDGKPCKVDPGFGDAMKARFEALGLGDMLH